MMPTAPMAPPPAPLEHESGGGRLTTRDPRTLPLKSARVQATASGGIARVVLEQRFHNPYQEPLSVTYLMPLPADGAVSAYAFRIGDRRIAGQVDRRSEARERFEQAIAAGKTAAILDEERSSLFTQEIGNIPPGVEVVAELTIDQPLRWLDEGAWEWRFPTASAPRYLGAPERVADARAVTHDVLDRPLGVRCTLDLSVKDPLPVGRLPGSPSHAVSAATVGGTHVVHLAGEDGAALDRDVVVTWPVASGAVSLSADVASADRGDGDAYALVTVLPPLPQVRAPRAARDLILLFDTSGSMGGAPLEQSRRVALALIDTLTEADQLEMIEFSSSARRWGAHPVSGTPQAKHGARAWLSALQARGGTEMREGIIEALRGLRADSQRQVVLFTDGLIGFESEVVHAVLTTLPASSRVHAVGVGSSVNRSLTGPVSRAGRGVEVVIGVDEDPEKAAHRIVARTDAPLVVDVSLGGAALLEHAPARLPDLFAGAPLLVAARVRAEGGPLTVRGTAGGREWAETIQVRPAGPGSGNPGIRALFARERVLDLETELAAGGDRKELEGAIERIGLEFQIATHLTSWVAVSEEVSVDPRDPSRREAVPQELPYGMSIEGLGLRGTSAPGPVPTQSLAAGGMAEPRMRSKRIGAPVAPAPTAGRAYPAARPAMPRRPAPVKPDVTRDAPPPPPAAPASIASAAAPPMEEAKVASGPTRTLGGRVVTSSAGELVIEVTVVGADLEWLPLGTALVTLAGGATQLVPLALEHTTRTGTVQAGLTIRVALRTGDPAPTLEQVEISLASGALLVVL